MLINTSFNVRGEPIVCTPEDAYRCFMATNMDALVIERTVLLKAEQPLTRDFDPSDYATAFQADRSLLNTEQLAEEEILSLTNRAG